MTTVKKRHAEIAGAGIAGLASAIALAQRGWSVRIHERSPELRAQGAGIYIWENGLRVLSALDVFDTATCGCHLGVLRETRDERNRTVAVARWTQAPGRRVVSVSRQQLSTALAQRAQELGVEICFGEEAISATPDGTIVLKDRRCFPADLAVAADGINSKVRDALGLLQSRTPLPDGAIRVLIPRTDGERGNAEGSKYVEYWSGHRRILYTPCSDAEVYLALTTLESDAAGKRVPLDKVTWQTSFPHLAALIDRIDDVSRWDRFETVRLSRWSDGHVAIVGDAAHAQAPNLGQGGGCSLMNALALAVALQETSDVVAGLARWEQAERPLTEHTQRVSALYGKVTTMPPLIRAGLLWCAGKSRWATGQRMRTALHAPTGWHEEGAPRNGGIQ